MFNIVIIVIVGKIVRGVLLENEGPPPLKIDNKGYTLHAYAEETCAFTDRPYNGVNSIGVLVVAPEPLNSMLVCDLREENEDEVQVVEVQGDVRDREEDKGKDDKDVTFVGKQTIVLEGKPA